MSSFEGYRQNNDGDRTQARGSRRAGKPPPPISSKQPANNGSSPTASTMTPLHHDGRSQGDSFAWGPARDRSGQARKAKGPSVPAPANVASSAGHNFQTLGNMPMRSSGQGGMQVLGKTAQSCTAPRAVPVVPGAPESALPKQAASTGAGSAATVAPVEAPVAAHSEPTTAAAAQPPPAQPPPPAAAAAAQPPEDGVAAPPGSAAGPVSGAEARDGQTADADRAAPQLSNSSGSNSAAAPSQPQGQRQGRGRGNSNQRSPHRSNGQQGNQRWGTSQSMPQGAPQQTYQGYPSQIPPSYQGYQAYSPVQHIPFGQQPVYFGNMTAQVPAPFVPTVPAVRTYATSYAAASKGTLQPDAAPFVSASAAANALPYKPYQVKPPPTQSTVPLQAPAAAAVPAVAASEAPTPAAMQPFFVPLLPSSAQSGSSQAAGHGQATASTPRTAGRPQQPPPVTLATITPVSQAANGGQTPPRLSRPLPTPSPKASAAAEAPSVQSAAPVPLESEAKEAVNSSAVSAVAHAEVATADRKQESGGICSAPAEAVSCTSAAPAAQEPSITLQQEQSASLGTVSSSDPSLKAERTSAAGRAGSAPQEEKASAAPTVAAATATSGSKASEEKQSAPVAEEKGPRSAPASQPQPVSVSPRQAAPTQRPQQSQLPQRQPPPAAAKPASLLPATAGWGGKRKIAPAAPAAPAAAMPAPVAQPAGSSRPVSAKHYAPSQAGPSLADTADAPTLHAAQPAPSAAKADAVEAPEDPVAGQPPAEPAPPAAPAAASAPEASEPAAPAAKPAAVQEKPTAAAEEEKPAPVAQTSAAAMPQQPASTTALPTPPAPVVVAEAPKPKTWATMAKALTTEAGPATFKHAPPKLVTPKSPAPTGGFSDRSRQGRGQSESSRLSGRREASRDGPREGQRGRGRGEQGAHRREDGSQQRPPGDRSRDGRDRRGPQRDARPGPSGSASGQRRSDGASNSGAAADVRPTQQPAAPRAEEPTHAASSAPAAPVQAPADSTPAASEQTAAQAPEKPAAETAIVQEAQESSAQADRHPPAQSEAGPTPAAAATEQAAVPDSKPPAAAPAAAPLSGSVLAAVRRLCGAVEELAELPSRRFAPRGLVNTGNLCFMNSILQALMGGRQFCALLQGLQAAAPALPPSELPTLHALSALAAEFLESPAADAPALLANGEVSKAGPKEPVYKAKDPPKSAWAKPDTAGGNAATLAARLAQQALLPDMMFPTVNRFNPNNGRPLPTANGKATAAAAAAAAATRQQEDAQEFLNFLLDSTHQELLRLRALHAGSLGDPGEATSAEAAGDEEEWLMAGRSKKKKAVTRGTTSIQGGTTLASAVFGGALRSEVKAAGAPASATLEPCFVVHLDIHPETVHSVADALRAFTSAETISGYKVRDNSEGVTARKVVQMYQLPRILVLHLKRFSYGLSGTGKIHKIVHYGERLWIHPAMMSEGCPVVRHRGGAEYELIAVVHHHGRTPAAGHYTADVRQPDTKWLRFDDADLAAVPLARVVDDNKAYLLFYQLRG